MYELMLEFLLNVNIGGLMFVWIKKKKEDGNWKQKRRGNTKVKKSTGFRKIQDYQYISRGVTVINISYLRIQVNTQTSEIHPH